MRKLIFWTIIAGVVAYLFSNPPQPVPKPVPKPRKQLLPRNRWLYVYLAILVAATAAVAWVIFNSGSFLSGRNTKAADAPVIVAAGDISCDPADESFNGGKGTQTRCRQLATSDLALKIDPQNVLLLGDNQYENGTLATYMASYDLSWGRLKAITKPIPGNHEYNDPGAAGYFDYFGPLAGERDKGYYSFDLGSWHIVALNSNCEFVGGCDVGSAQMQWLLKDLADNAKPCTLAYWHYPLFSSGEHGDSLVVKPLWQALQNVGAEAVLAGHDHIYERFAPQRADGTPDANGIAQFIVGGSGKNHHEVGPPKPNSEVRNSSDFGVLKMTLRDSSYGWEYVAEGGVNVDSGQAECSPRKDLSKH